MEAGRKKSVTSLPQTKHTQPQLGPRKCRGARLSRHTQEAARSPQACGRAEELPVPSGEELLCKKKAEPRNSPFLEQCFSTVVGRHSTGTATHTSPPALPRRGTWPWCTSTPVLPGFPLTRLYPGKGAAAAGAGAGVTHPLPSSAGATAATPRRHSLFTFLLLLPRLRRPGCASWAGAGAGALGGTRWRAARRSSRPAPRRATPWPGSSGRDPSAGALAG